MTHGEKESGGAGVAAMATLAGDLVLAGFSGWERGIDCLLVGLNQSRLLEPWS